MSLEEFKKKKLTDKPEKLYAFIKEELNRKKIYSEMKDAIDAMSDSDYDDAGETSEKRKINDIQSKASEISVKGSSSEESPEKHPSKKVKIEVAKEVEGTAQPSLLDIIDPESLEIIQVVKNVEESEKIIVDLCENGSEPSNFFEKQHKLSQQNIEESLTDRNISSTTDKSFSSETSFEIPKLSKVKITDFFKPSSSQ